MAGAATVIMYLLHVGVPICTWQRAVRCKDADKYPKLRSYAFHVVCRRYAAA